MPPQRRRAVGAAGRREGAALKTLLIDNHDSFTFNLYHLLAEVNGVAPDVVRNDEAVWADLATAGYDNVVISPGPGRPQRAADVGLALDAIRSSRVPLLGVCLGHQGIGHVFGAVVDRAPEPMHGRVSKISHSGKGLFAGIPSPFSAVRYHSLAVRDLPGVLQCTARSDDGVVMALRHRRRPLWGVQFHPESICSEHGRALLDNFRRLTEQRDPAGQRDPAEQRGPAGRRRAAARGPERQRGPTSGAGPAFRRPASPEKRFAFHVRPLGFAVDAEHAYLTLFAGSRRSFWLDSASVLPGHSRFSYLGDGAGPHAEHITYDVARQRVEVSSGGITETCRMPFLDYLDRELRRRRVDGRPPDCDFDLGYVGFLGYELKADCGGGAGHPSPTPDAAALFADRMLVIDHETDTAALVALSQPATRSAVQGWLDETARRLAASSPRPPPAGRAGATADVAVRFRHDADAYRALVARCRREIADGESYELCLTNTLTVDAAVDPVAVHLELRRANPAPYAALLRLGDVAVVSSSPERFLRIDRAGTVESKPIKGTRRRGSTVAEDAAARNELANSEKDLAENLMIVDLMRNDLGRVCEVGSVSVPRLFDVETYATVHQLVSTVRGRLRADRTPVDAVRATFPGGSMTGAPKERSMAILDRLEQGPRGVYSGALGFFGLGGAIDLSIVIRTVVVTHAAVTVGVGGAVVALSDPQSELDETLVKAEPMLAALARSAASCQARLPRPTTTG